MKQIINIKNTEVSLYSKSNEDYISLTDIAKYKGDRSEQIIQNWLRNRNTIEFLYLWEKINNKNFKHLECEVFKKEAGLNSFTLSPKKWIETTNAIGIISKSGRYGGTYAHKDIAFEFANWISIEFRLYFIKEFQRLKEEEQKNKSLEWSVKRELTKINYKLQTDSIKKGNLRDYASIEQLLLLANLENLNLEFIKQGLSKEQRYEGLAEITKRQYKILFENNFKKLEK